MRLPVGIALYDGAAGRNQVGGARVLMLPATSTTVTTSGMYETGVSTIGRVLPGLRYWPSLASHQLRPAHSFSSGRAAARRPVDGREVCQVGTLGVALI